MHRHQDLGPLDAAGGSLAGCPQTRSGLEQSALDDLVSRGSLARPSGGLAGPRSPRWRPVNLQRWGAGADDRPVPDLADYADDLHFQSLYLEAVVEALIEANSAALPKPDRERDLEFALSFRRQNPAFESCRCPPGDGGLPRQRLACFRSTPHQAVIGAIVQWRPAARLTSLLGALLPRRSPSPRSQLCGRAELHGRLDLLAAPLVRAPTPDGSPGHRSGRARNSRATSQA